MTFNPRSFREYDIRGVADRDLDDATVTALGEVLAEAVVAGGHPRTAVVGADCRLHSPRLFAALTAGLRTQLEVTDLGMVATPMLYFAHHTLKPGVAVMITGSHNPGDDNGFKMMLGGKTLYGPAITALRDAVALRLAAPGPSATPHPIVAHQIDDAYLAHALGQARLGARRMRVVVDGGNGAGGPTAIALYRAAGFDVVPLYCEPDGRFPNHHPDPTVAANLTDLIAAVEAHGAEVGLALDGDADRLGAVDATGRILWGDQLMILLGRAVLEEVPGARFVGEVKCSQGMFDELRRAGGEAEMWKVGHSLIKARMKETGASLAGEMSGHLFFAHRYLGFDDAIYAGLRLLELLSRGARTLAQHAATLPVSVATPELRVACSDDHKFGLVAEVTARLGADPTVRELVTLDGVRAIWADGWGLVRASNTQAALVVRCEAETADSLALVRTRIAQAIEASQTALGLPVGVDLTGH